MTEQRYVVEITRPVAPEKVELVAERIAGRLNVPHARIVTLLDGRTGPVTKPVLSAKADAIAEVFAEAGVRVLVAAALAEPPAYQEEFAAPEPEPAPSAAVQPGPPGPAPERAQPAEDAAAQPAEAPPTGPAKAPAASRPPDEADTPPWADSSWGWDAAGDDTWKVAAQPAAAPTEPAPAAPDPAPEAAPAPAPVSAPTPAPEPHPLDDPEQDDGDAEAEADRLGRAPGQLRVDYQPPPAPAAAPAARPDAQEYAAATRWTPSPHDPYAFAPEDAVGFDSARPSPIGPARTTPLDASRGGREGFYSPEPPPRQAPRLRNYLLWALGISLLALVLLQFVMAARVGGGAAELTGFELGLIAYRKGDFAAARRSWQKVAEAGHAQAQYLLGFMLQNGMGQPWSNARAANWYRQAASQGLPSAQLALGNLYLRGMGVQQDLRMGATWYASAAVAGDPTGQLEYAKLLLHGVGVQQDMSAALAWFEAAAANGVQEAADYVAYARSLTN